MLQVKVSTPFALEQDPHSSAHAQRIANLIMDALGLADRVGMVVEVTLESVPPLAQGRYRPHIQIRERKDLGMLREKVQTPAFLELTLEPQR